LLKYLVILTDGMADEPLQQLKGRTPLQVAHTPNIDKLAKLSHIGMVATIPEGFSPGSDVANLSVLGYDPAIYYTGRSPLEAVSMGIALGDQDLAFRCNLVTLSSHADSGQQTMADYSAGEISTRESAVLIKDLARELIPAGFELHAGISYRHLLIWKNGRGKDIHLTPPHDISDRQIGAYLPSGTGAAPLLDIIKHSQEFLSRHPINQERIKSGRNPANSVWFWGEGVRPALPTFSELYGIKGAVVGAVDLIKGLGISAGLQPIQVEGATGAIITNFAGKAEAAIQALKSGYDFVYVHIESPDEAGHQGNLEQKIWSIEQIDQEVIERVINVLPELEPVRILIMPDHPTPIRIKTHSGNPVPYLLFDSEKPVNNSIGVYDETEARQGIMINNGHELMSYFITSK